MDVARAAAVLAREGVIVGPELSKGSFSRVFVAELRGDSKSYAVKVTDLTLAPAQVGGKFLPRELAAVCKLHHPNIVEVHRIIRIGSLVCLLMDAAQKTLACRLLQEGRVGDEDTAANLFHQIVSGVAFCHHHKIAHRDIKADNILLDAKGRVKLCDFGYCFLDAETETLTDTFCGSFAYAAPEVIGGRTYNPYKSDIWALGVVLYTIITNELPFKETLPEKMIKKQLTKNWQIPVPLSDIVSPGCQALVAVLLEPDGALRPAAAELFKDTWLTVRAGNLDGN